jgi:hypothetical protein
MIMEKLSLFSDSVLGSNLQNVKNLNARKVRDTNHNGYDDNSEHNSFYRPVSSHKPYQKPSK